MHCSSNSVKLDRFGLTVLICQSVLWTVTKTALWHLLGTESCDLSLATPWVCSLAWPWAHLTEVTLMSLPGGPRHDKQINKDKVLQLTGNYDRMVSLLTLPFHTGCFRRRRRRISVDSTAASGQSSTCGTGQDDH